MNGIVRSRSSNSLVTYRPRLPLAAIESSHARPMPRTAFEQARIVHVMEGHGSLETEVGTLKLATGSAISLGAGLWCALRPTTMMRTWTICIDHEFLGDQLAWCLPDRTHLIPDVHTTDWDGSPVLMEHPIETLHRLEPLWRRISILNDPRVPREVAATQSMVLFPRTAGLALDTLLLERSPATPDDSRFFPVMGNLTAPAMIGTVGHAAQRGVALMVRTSRLRDGPRAYGADLAHTAQTSRMRRKLRAFGADFALMELTSAWVQITWPGDLLHTPDADSADGDRLIP